MSDLTSAQLTTLGHQFLDMGSTILNYRENHTEISDEQDSTLEELQNNLLAQARTMAAMSTVSATDEAANAVTALAGVNAQIGQTLKTLTDVQKVIDVATAALKVVVAVISLKPGDIVNSIGDLATTCGVKINL